mmetsp:Transcript_22335/g.73423  ORF Transcript_22335/g.73423 Transcript_22335/m.73423 type:complete len:363 (-) Transcript_22335:185-1273(-)
MLLVEDFNLLNERCNRFFGGGNKFRHPIVPYHKVRCRGIFIDKQDLGSNFKAFNDVCCLGSTSGSVGGAKIYGWSSEWKILNERRYVDILYAPSIFSSDRHGMWVGDHKLSSITRNVIVDALLQCLEQSRFAVETSTDDERDSSWDSHSGHFPSVRELKTCTHGSGTLESDYFLSSHGKVAVSSRSRQNGSIGNKRDQSSLLQFSSEGLGVFNAVNMLLDLRWVVRIVDEGSLDHSRKRLDEDAPGLPSEDRSTCSRKSNGESSLHEIRRDENVSPFQNLLSRTLHLQVSSLGATPPLTRRRLVQPLLAYNRAEGPRKKVAQPDPPRLLVEQTGRELGGTLGHPDVAAGRRSVRVRLDVIEG